jgi:hypothetical protein
LTDRDRCIDTRPASAAAIPNAVTIVGMSGHLRRNTHEVAEISRGLSVNDTIPFIVMRGTQHFTLDLVVGER